MTEQAPNATTLLSVDWGTSRLRVRLVQTEPLAVLAELANDDGIAAVFAAWRTSGESDREGFFLGRLRAAIQKLCQTTGRKLDQTPVILSGMASASIGMRELPYALAPVALEAAALITDWLPPTQTFPHPALLISGVATEGDVMRGEETQLLGLLAHGGDGLYVLPGTHSKHVEVRKGRIEAFRTYMTGELFSLIARQSVLVDCVEARSEAAPTPSFEQGVTAAACTNLLHEVFAIRARTLVAAQTDRHANGDYLSGLLIGGELRDLVCDQTDGIIVAATGALRERYIAALHVFGLAGRMQTLAESIVRDATALGHVEIYQQIGRHSKR